MSGVMPYGGYPNEWFPEYSGPLTNYGDFDRTFGNIDRELYGMRQWMERAFRNFHEIDRKYSPELNQHPTRPANMIEHYSLLNPIRNVSFSLVQYSQLFIYFFEGIDSEGNRWLNCYFDLRSYKPEEINVTLNSKERCINVEAQHEVKDSKEHYIKRSYSRKMYLPADLKVDLSKIELKSALTNEGLLCIEAALPKLSLEEARSFGESKSMSSVNPAVFNVPVKTI